LWYDGRKSASSRSSSNGDEEVLAVVLQIDLLDAEA
jgi:hypothetical protein